MAVNRRDPHHAPRESALSHAHFAEGDTEVRRVNIHDRGSNLRNLAPARSTTARSICARCSRGWDPESPRNFKNTPRPGISHPELPSWTVRGAEPGPRGSVKGHCRGGPSSRGSFGVGSLTPRPMGASGKRPGSNAAPYSLPMGRAPFPCHFNPAAQGRQFPREAGAQTPRV